MIFRLSGLLGQITQTADVSTCPGKCIHAIASLICDEVRQDIQCPSRSMRCCVERANKRPARPLPVDQKLDSVMTTTEETTTRKRIKKKKTTTESPATTQPTRVKKLII